METQHSKPMEDKERFFHTELVKFGVEYEKAKEAARILASGLPDEVLAQEEIKIAKEACKKWLEYNKRYKRVKNIQF